MTIDRTVEEMSLKLLPFDQLDTDSITLNQTTKRNQVRMKILLDFLGAGALLVFLAPVYCLLAVLVRLQDGGPAIYKRRVIGPSGEFFAYKFRTMCVDADQLLTEDPLLRPAFERNFKLANDPRVTKLGSFLRKYSLDEIPQFFNVLKGQMSLVGPRMITAAELEKYGAYRDVLMTVRPGITGYWQVNGRQHVSYEERVRMDMFYILNWSIWLDLTILANTPLKVLMGHGAY
jgi:lipopolysaccharide/colanic/teichoic acid biosynthesis glycosyltransferase